MNSYELLQAMKTKRRLMKEMHSQQVLFDHYNTCLKKGKLIFKEDPPEVPKDWNIGKSEGFILEGHLYGFDFSLDGIITDLVILDEQFLPECFAKS